MNEFLSYVVGAFIMLVIVCMIVHWIGYVIEMSANRD